MPRRRATAPGPTPGNEVQMHEQPTEHPIRWTDGLPGMDPPRLPVKKPGPKGLARYKPRPGSKGGRILTVAVAAVARYRDEGRVNLGSREVGYVLTREGFTHGDSRTSRASSSERDEPGTSRWRPSPTAARPRTVSGRSRLRRRSPTNSASGSARRNWTAKPASGTAWRSGRRPPRGFPGWCPVCAEYGVRV